MKQIKVKIYIKHRRRALATIIFESEAAVEKFLTDMNVQEHETDVIRLYNIAFNKSEFRYATIK